MAKKRVHEIAKDLKAYGIELDNKGVVTELLALGYDVKSHSSSLEDDQANAAIQRIVELRKPRAAPAPVAAKGFVVRRRVGTPAAEAEHKPPAEVEAPVETQPALPPAQVAPPPPVAPPPAAPPPPVSLAGEPIRPPPAAAKPVPPPAPAPPSVSVPVPVAAQARKATTARST